MIDEAHRTPIDEDAEDALFRLLNTTQQMQRRIMRMVRRGFISKVSAVELEWDAQSIARDVADLTTPAQMETS